MQRTGNILYIAPAVVTLAWYYYIVALDGTTGTVQYVDLYTQQKMKRKINLDYNFCYTWPLSAHQTPRVLYPLSPTPHISACAGPHIRGKQSLMTAIDDL